MSGITGQRSRYTLRNFLPVAGVCLLALAADGYFSASAAGQVTAQRYRINIGAMSVEAALLHIQRQTGISVVFSPGQLKNRRIEALRGSFTPLEAIEEVLSGSSFVLRRNGKQFLIVADSKQADQRGEAEERLIEKYSPSIRSIFVAPSLEEILVTGTRLTTGFETGTPVMTFSGDALMASAPSSIVDSLKQLPTLSGTINGSQSISGTNATGANGQSLLNMRNLGTNRNLVLLNGRRIVASNVNNSVDMNTIPQNLVERVDVVTGGASAAYGSDAVAGVANFILDTDFVGLKGEIGGGISTFGDVPNYKASLAWGGTLASERLHVVASTQYARRAGTRVHQVSGRDWWDKPWGLISNNTGIGPKNLVLPDIRSSVGTDGGLITNTLLKGTQFAVGGHPVPFDYGYNAGSAWQSGGDGAWISFNLTPDQWRITNFAHAVYDVAEDTQIYAETGYAYANTTDPNQKPINTGARFNYTIFSGNPFLPDSIQVFMEENGIPSFRMGRYMREYPDVTIVTDTHVLRQALGIKGWVGVGRWSYDLSVSHGRTNQRLAQNNLTIARPTYAAADAVVHPVTGQTVCRSQYYRGDVFVPEGTGLDVGCKPQNLFGSGSVSPTTIAYTIGNSWKKFDLSQVVFMGAVSGDLGDLAFDAGPISIAAGFEYRTERGSQIADDISVTTIDFSGIRGGPRALQGQQGPFRFANFQPFHGRYSVKEMFAEVGMPIAADLPLVDMLSVDAALRYTDYSTSGGVTTWKAGLDYSVSSSLRFRGTLSRDIRAPNLLELFNSASQNSQNQFYPSTFDGIATPVVQITSGNPDLLPERAITRTYGAIFTPAFANGLRLSIDYYNIEISGGIQAFDAQQTIDNCYLRVPEFCQYVEPISGAIRVRTPFLNLAKVKAAGVDIEAQYATKLWGHPLDIGVLAMRLSAASTQPVGGEELSTLGGNNDPRWRINLKATYDINDWSVFVQQRFISAKLVDARRVEGEYVDDNTVAPAFYTDLTVSYGFEALGAKSELYLTVNNLFNQEPPKDVGPPSSFVQPGNRTVYDWLGRYFNLGLRFKY